MVRLLWTLILCDLTWNFDHLSNSGRHAFNQGWINRSTGKPISQIGTIDSIVPIWVIGLSVLLFIHPRWLITAWLKRSDSCFNRASKLTAFEELTSKTPFHRQGRNWCLLKWIPQLRGRQGRVISYKQNNELTCLRTCLPLTELGSVAFLERQKHVFHLWTVVFWTRTFHFSDNSTD